MIRSWNALRSSLARMTFFVATLTALAGAARADVTIGITNSLSGPAASIAARAPESSMSLRWS